MTIAILSIAASPSGHSHRARSVTVRTLLKFIFQSKSKSVKLGKSRVAIAGYAQAKSCRP